MNETLLQLKLEKDNVSELLVSRSAVLKEYLKVLDVSILATKQAIELHEKETKEIVVKKQQEQANLDKTLGIHNLAKEKHESFLKEKDAQTVSLGKLIEDKNSEVARLNKTIDSLMVEYRSVEEQLRSDRGQVSALERRIVELKSQESILLKSIEDKTKIEGDLKVSIDERSKEHSKVLQDITILNSRK